MAFMSLQSKHEVLAQSAPRYRAASHRQKFLILDECVANTNYARKYAIRILHCSPTTRLSHERLTTEGFTVLTPSRPGYDATPAQAGRTAQQAAAALAALLDTLAIPAVTVLGISVAGPTALAFPQQHPDRTTGLILESAVTLPWDTAPPEMVHGGADAVVAARQSVLTAAVSTHPEHFVRGLPTPPAVPCGAWINPLPNPAAPADDPARLKRNS